MARFCYNCGAPLKDVARFCPSCGTPQDEDSVPASAAVPAEVSAAAPATPVPAAPAPVVTAPAVPAPVPPAPVVPAPVEAPVEQPSVAPVPAAPIPVAPAAPVSVAPVAPAPVVPVAPVSVVTSEVAAPKKEKKPKSGLGKAIVGWTVVVVLIGLIGLCVWGTVSTALQYYHPYENAIGLYMDVHYSGNYNIADFKALAPEEYWEYCEKDGRESPEEAFADAKEWGWYEISSEEYGSDTKYAYEFLWKTKMTKDDPTFKGIEDKYDLDVEAGYYVAVKITLSGSKKTEEWIRTMPVVKVDGEWYCANFPYLGYNYYY